MKNYEIKAPIKVRGKLRRNGTVELSETVGAALVRDGFLVELHADNDPGDEQPPASTETQPGAERTEGLIPDTAAVASASATVAASTESAADVQTTTAGEQIAPVGGETPAPNDPVAESGTADAGAALSAAPAEAAPTQAAPPTAAKPKAKAKPKTK